MDDFSTKIGEVTSVSGSTVTVQLNDNIKSNLPIIDGEVYKIGQIGSFLKIPLGYSVLFGIITQTGAAAMPNNIVENIISFSDLKNSQWVTLSLVGEMIGSKFERGISQSPTTGDVVHLVTLSDLSIVYQGGAGGSSIRIGNISSSSSLPALLDLDNLISRHFAILGSTGSGKSNAVGVIVNSIENKKFKSSRVIIIDPHGEYSESIAGSKVYQLRPEKGKNKLVIPFWALPFDELMLIFGSSLSEETKLDYIREKITKEKIASNKANSYGVKEELITADTPIPFDIKKVWFDLDDFERQTFLTNDMNGPKATDILGDCAKLKSTKYKTVGIGSSGPFSNRFAKGIGKFLEGMRMKLMDKRYKFLFEPDDLSSDAGGKTKKDLDGLLFDWIGSKGVTVFDLSDVPSEIMISIIGTLLKIIYDTIYWGQETLVGGKKQPLLIILEEAHNYLRPDSKTISAKTVQKIAREGRKYGVGLCLVSQRPSELDETILSQCGTIIGLRMNNYADRNYVKGAIQDELQGLIDILPSLRTGEAIVSGEGVKIPSRIQFYKLTKAVKGSNPLVSETWCSNTNPSEEDYTDVIARWRNQSFYKED
jgi:Predicted ATPase